MPCSEIAKSQRGSGVFIFYVWLGMLQIFNFFMLLFNFYQPKIGDLTLALYLALFLSIFTLLAHKVITFLAKITILLLLFPAFLLSDIISSP